MARRPPTVAQPCVQPDPGLQRRHLVVAERPFQADRVLAFHAVARVQHPIGPRPVVGQEQHPFAVLVQAADRVEQRHVRHEGGRDEVQHGRLGMAIAVVEVTPAGLCSNRYA